MLESSLSWLVGQGSHGPAWFKALIIAKAWLPEVYIEPCQWCVIAPGSGSPEIQPLTLIHSFPSSFTVIPAELFGALSIAP